MMSEAAEIEEINPEALEKQLRDQWDVPEPSNENTPQTIQNYVDHYKRLFEQASAEKVSTAHRRGFYTLTLVTLSLLKAFRLESDQTNFEVNSAIAGVLAITTFGYFMNYRYDQRISKLGQMAREADERIANAKNGKDISTEKVLTRDQIAELATKSHRENKGRDIQVESSGVMIALFLSFSIATAQIVGVKSNDEINKAELVPEGSTITTQEPK